MHRPREPIAVGKHWSDRGFQMSFGKLTLLSADCLGSGAMVGSSRMVADSSGTCGAPGAEGFAAAGLAVGTLSRCPWRAADRLAGARCAAAAGARGSAARGATPATPPQ